LVIFGSSAGNSGELPLQAVYRKGITVFGYAGLLGTQTELARAKRQALQAIAEGRVLVEIGAKFPIEQANEALECLADRRVRGKLLLDLTD
jgi:NADPH:quinone reductase